VVSRNKKRIGYELEVEVRFEGISPDFEGSECTVTLAELCDDGSDPDASFQVHSSKDGKQDALLKSKLKEKGAKELWEKIVEILGWIKDEL